MRQFGALPIYINSPDPKLEESRKRSLREFTKKGDQHMMEWLRNETAEHPYGAAKKLFEIQRDMTPTYAGKDYENQVYDVLTKIASTRIGKLLFDLLKKDVDYWILPLEDSVQEACNCQARTFQGQYPKKVGGGVRTYFTPGKTNPICQHWFSADDILFHELVHAHRAGKGLPSEKTNNAMNAYTNGEEFIALHMQNVYLDGRGSLRFYKSDSELTGVSKGTAYQYFSGDAEVLMAFRYFVSDGVGKDPLAEAVSKWTVPPASFNPWRDQPYLERIYLDDPDLVGVQHLPPW